MSKLFLIIASFFVLGACTNSTPVPKPPTYLRLDLPEHSYHNVVSECPYELRLADSYNHKSGQSENGMFCTQEVDLGPLNGTLFLFYMHLPSKDSLEAVINFANDKVDEHKIKADKIDFKQIVNKKDKVYGTFFELRGNVATNFQFYLTDSSKNFVRGEVLMNCRPNYDSLRPVLEYLKVDLLEMVDHFKWKKSL